MMTNSTQLSALSPTFSSLSSSSLSPIKIRCKLADKFQLVWLDPNVDTDVDNLATCHTLQCMFTHVHTFNNCSICEHWLKNATTDKKIILIVSGEFGKTVIPHAHDLESIAAIYIYCLNRAHHEQWANKYSKVYGIVTANKDLTQQLSSYQDALESIEDSKTMQILRFNNSNDDASSNTASFIWFKLLLEILVSPSYLPQRSTIDELTELLRQYCGDNTNHLTSIEEFKKTYDAKQALAWLINETPVKRIIDRALREQDILMLFLFRSFLAHIHTQLATHSSDIQLTYKLQLMPLEVVERLKTDQNQHLFFPEFTFASTNKPDLNIIGNDHHEFQTVLIEILTPFRCTKWPFARVNNAYSSSKDCCSNDVIFMCGSIFQIGSMQAMGRSTWTLRLILANGRKFRLLETRHRQLRRSQDLCLIGDLLQKLDQHDKACVYYNCLLRELHPDHVLLSSIKEKLSHISEIKQISLIDVQFVVVDLSTRLSSLATAMLDALRQLTNETIQIYNDESSLDWQRFSGKSVYLFTSSQFIMSMNSSNKQNLSIFVLESDTNKINHRTRLATSEDLICQLADEIYRCYMMETQKYSTRGNTKKAKYAEKLADQIHSVLRTVHTKMLSVDNNDQSHFSVQTEIVCLQLKGQANLKFEQNNRDIIDIIGSYSMFENVDDCRKHIYHDSISENTFLIIDQFYYEEIRTEFESVKNIKRLYYYGSSSSEKNIFISNPTDLRYRLTYDLMIHYNDLATHGRVKDNQQLTRHMFTKAKKLCDILVDL